MRKKKLIYLSVIASGIVGGGFLLAGGTALAKEAAGTYPMIVQNIAEKFDLDPDDVQTVFTETRETERESRQDERLDDLVDDQVITEAQRTKLEAKIDEFRAAREKLNGTSMTMDERRSAMEKLRADYEQWLDDNDFPSSVARMLGGMGRGGLGGPGDGMRGDGFGPDSF